MMKRLLAGLSLTLVLAGCELSESSAAPGNTSEGIHEDVESDYVSAVVQSVYDGDTFLVRIAETATVQNVELVKGTEIPVRLLLVDTPESVGEKAGMPYGEESSAFAKGLLSGQTVQLEFDEGEIFDKYDRLLAYAYVGENRVQDMLLENGYAMVRYVYEPSTRYADEFRALEDSARENSLGIWSIENYVSVGEGYNEVGLKSDLEAIGEDVKEQAKGAAENFVEDALNSIFN